MYVVTQVSQTHRRVMWGLLGCAIFMQSGCVRRRMTIRTNPPGAMVYIDDQPIGVTPLSTNFTYYGVRSIKIFKDRFRTETKLHRFSPPWYQISPLDFVTENFWPFEIRDERVLEFQLVPQAEVSTAELRQRGETLRANVRSGTVSPLVPSQPSAAPVELPPTQPSQRAGLPREGLPLEIPELPVSRIPRGRLR